MFPAACTNVESPCPGIDPMPVRHQQRQAIPGKRTVHKLDAPGVILKVNRIGLRSNRDLSTAVQVKNLYFLILRCVCNEVLVDVESEVRINELPLAVRRKDNQRP